MPDLDTKKKREEAENQTVARVGCSTRNRRLQVALQTPPPPLPSGLENSSKNISFCETWERLSGAAAHQPWKVNLSQRPCIMSAAR